MQASQKWSEKRWERLKHRKAAKSVANVSEHHPCLGTSNVLYSWWPNSTFLSWTCRHPLYPPPRQYNSHCKIPTLSQQQGCLRWPCLSNTPAMEAPWKTSLLPLEQGWPFHYKIPSYEIQLSNLSTQRSMWLLSPVSLLFSVKTQDLCRQRTWISH